MRIGLLLTLFAYVELAHEVILERGGGGFVGGFVTIINGLTNPINAKPIIGLVGIYNVKLKINEHGNAAFARSGRKVIAALLTGFLHVRYNHHAIFGKQCAQLTGHGGVLNK